MVVVAGRVYRVGKIYKKKVIYVRCGVGMVCSFCYAIVVLSSLTPFC